MDWLRVFIAAYAVVILVSMAASIAQIGQPRKPVSATTAGCTVFIFIPVFIGFLLVWQRLGE